MKINRILILSVLAISVSLICTEVLFARAGMDFKTENTVKSTSFNGECKLVIPENGNPTCVPINCNFPCLIIKDYPAGQSGVVYSCRPCGSTLVPGTHSCRVEFPNPAGDAFLYCEIK